MCLGTLASAAVFIRERTKCILLVILEGQFPSGDAKDGGDKILEGETELCGCDAAVYFLLRRA